MGQPLTIIKGGGLPAQILHVLGVKSDKGLQTLSWYGASFSNKKESREEKPWVNRSSLEEKWW